MIDVKQAVAVANQFFQSIYGEDKSLSDIQLEEVELTEDSKYWLITLSYLQQKRNPRSIVMPLPPKRLYKVFKVNAKSGQPQAMKIREVA